MNQLNIISVAGVVGVGGIDSIDIKLLLELMNNSRQSYTKLAKKIKSSREVISYRIKKLVKSRIIKSFVTEIDETRLGFIGAAVFLTIKVNKEDELKQFLNNCGYVSWVAELSGNWSFGFSIYGKSNQELDERFQEIYSKFKDSIINYRFSLHKKTEFFYEKYFLKNPLYLKKKFENKKIDKIDLLILKELSKDSRIDSLKLSKLINISAVAVAQRIKKLEKSIIKRYSIFIDLNSLNLLQYSVFIMNQSKEIIGYLSQHPKVSFVAEYIGDPFIEFGVVLKTPYELREVLRDVEESFPNNKLIETSLFQNEFISISLPKIIFE